MSDLTPEEERVLVFAQRKLQLQSESKVTPKSTQSNLESQVTPHQHGHSHTVHTRMYGPEPEFQRHNNKNGGPQTRPERKSGDGSNTRLNKFMEHCLTLASYLFVILTLPLSLAFCIKVVQEYERAVIFRLGRLVSGGARGPGLFFILPCIDNYRSIDLRVMSYDVPPQEILSKDSVTVTVDAVVYFRTIDPITSVTNVSDAYHSTKLLTQTTLRNVLGTKTLSGMLSDREQIAHNVQIVLDEGTEPWGIKVERVEVKDIRLPQSLTRAMAAEAEATREAKAKVIAAEGEQMASQALKEAAEIMTQSPAALQLRYLQTLNSIAAEHNSTIIFPVPLALFSALENSVLNQINGANLNSHHQRPEVHTKPQHKGNLSTARQSVKESEKVVTSVHESAPIISAESITSLSQSMTQDYQL